MKNRLLAIMSIIILSISVNADTLKGGYGACLQKDLFDQLITASINKDERAFEYLLKNGCIITKAGIPITVIDRSWSGTAKIRAYVGNQAFILWTNNENIQKN